MNRPLCPPRYHEDEYGVTLLRCGRSVQDRDPRARREDGCAGGFFVCTACADIFGEFLKKAYDARAKRKEWED